MTLYRDQRLTISENEMAVYQRAFPHLNIGAVILEIEAWLMANPRKRYKNYNRFVVSWLRRANTTRIPPHFREAYDLCVGAYGYRNKDAVCKLWQRFFSNTPPKDFLEAIDSYLKDTYTPHKDWPTPASLKARLPKSYVPGA